MVEKPQPPEGFNPKTFFEAVQSLSETLKKRFAQSVAPVDFQAEGRPLKYLFSVGSGSEDLDNIGYLRRKGELKEWLASDPDANTMHSTEPTGLEQDSKNRFKQGGPVTVEVHFRVRTFVRLEPDERETFVNKGQLGEKILRALDSTTQPFGTKLQQDIQAEVDAFNKKYEGKQYTATLEKLKPEEAISPTGAVSWGENYQITVSVQK